MNFGILGGLAWLRFESEEGQSLRFVTVPTGQAACGTTPEAGALTTSIFLLARKKSRAPVKGAPKVN